MVSPVDQALDKPMLAKERCPMECRLSKETAAVADNGACIKQPDPDILSTEAGRSDKCRLVVATLHEINIRTRFKQCLDNRQFLAFWQKTAEDYVGDIMQRMMRELLTVLTKSDKRIRLCRIGRLGSAKRFDIAGSDRSSDVHGGPL